MNSKSKLHPDLVIAIASLLFGGLLLMTIRSYPEEVKLFPQIFLLLFIVFMAIILVQGVKKTLHPENYDSSEWWCTKETVQNPAISGALIIVYVVLLEIGRAHV